MILISCGRAEQREDAVAGRLHDVTLVTPHGFDRDAPGRVDDHARLPEIEVLHQLGRPLDVGE
jgi:hypothetical protein